MSLNPNQAANTIAGPINEAWINNVPRVMTRPNEEKAYQLSLGDQYRPDFMAMMTRLGYNIGGGDSTFSGRTLNSFRGYSSLQTMLASVVSVGTGTAGALVLAITSGSHNPDGTSEVIDGGQYRVGNKNGIATAVVTTANANTITLIPTSGTWPAYTAGDIVPLLYISTSLGESAIANPRTSQESVLAYQSTFQKIGGHMKVTDFGTLQDPGRFEMVWMPDGNGGQVATVRDIVQKKTWAQISQDYSRTVLLGDSNTNSARTASQPSYTLGLLPGMSRFGTVFPAPTGTIGKSFFEALRDSQLGAQMGTGTVNANIMGGRSFRDNIDDSLYPARVAATYPSQPEKGIDWNMTSVTFADANYRVTSLDEFNNNGLLAMMGFKSKAIIIPSEASVRMSDGKMKKAFEVCTVNNLGTSGPKLNPSPVDFTMYYGPGFSQETSVNYGGAEYPVNGNFNGVHIVRNATAADAGCLSLSYLMCIHRDTRQLVLID